MKLKAKRISRKNRKIQYSTYRLYAREKSNCNKLGINLDRNVSKRKKKFAERIKFVRERIETMIKPR